MGLSFYGAAIANDPVLGDRPFAFLRQTDEHGDVEMRALNTLQDIQSLKETFAKLAADKDTPRKQKSYLRAAWKEAAHAEKALLSLHRTNHIPKAPYVFADTGMTMYHCDGYRLIDDPEKGAGGHVFLRKRLAGSGQIVRWVMGYDAVRKDLEHVRDHAHDPDPAGRHGQPEAFFTAAAAELEKVERTMASFEDRLKQGENPAAIALELRRLGPG